jgi:DNA-binding response OmpR family regulator
MASRGPVTSNDGQHRVGVTLLVGDGALARNWIQRMTKLSTGQHILIIEHDEVMTATYARTLRLEGYQVQTALSAEEGLREVESSHPDAIIVDFHMPGMDGFEFLRRLRALDDTTPVAVVTGDYFLDETIPAQLRELGAEVRFKPLWLEDLATLVQCLLTSGRTRGT